MLKIAAALPVFEARPEGCFCRRLFHVEYKDGLLVVQSFPFLIFGLWLSGLESGACPFLMQTFEVLRVFYWYNQGVGMLSVPVQYFACGHLYSLTESQLLQIFHDEKVEDEDGLLRKGKERTGGGGHD